MALNRIFPEATHSEDQPYGKTILTTHVLHRGFQSGAFFGAAAYGIRSLRASPANAAASVAVPGLFHAATKGGLYGLPILALATIVRMWGREDIEWKDRSWRLLSNRGQLMCDDWSLGGTILGGLFAVARERGITQAGSGMRILGGAGLGNLIGVAGYMIYRYAIRGEEFEKFHPLDEKGNELGLHNH